ncbi:HNH endonuclease [Cohaesibacter celericrescens]|uniref:HNH endonuclease n=1 Tax=Cohaesibacter celericrescens TaxID=2067669 RepID=A0A2N5XX97_9HYPH|nr:HNH endonuclease [Cohaesibacter celericrescens]PLW79087.1 HNH endonuclease [Cohaesibacter celericrescens]
MKGVRIIYSKAELAWVEAHKTDVRKESHAVFVELFNRPDVSFENYKSLCSRNGWKTGRTGLIEKGNIPLNKGKKMPFNPNSARTQFKKGQTPHNANYLGHERVSKDGYVEISVDETNPHTGFERRYVLKHRWLWEQKNGPIKEGHCLKCLDGNLANTDPDNWVEIPRAMLPRLCGRYGRGFDHADPDLKPVIMAVTKLEHKARTVGKEADK